MKERIKLLRTTLGLTQQEFANRIGVKRNTVGQYEIGRNDPTDTVVSLICREFNVNRDWLLTGTGEMFVPESRGELDALARKYGYSAAVGQLVEKLVRLSPEQQEAVTDFLIELAGSIQSIAEAGADPRGAAFRTGATAFGKDGQAGAEAFDGEGQTEGKPMRAEAEPSLTEADRAHPWPTAATIDDKVDAYRRALESEAAANAASKGDESTTSWCG